VTAKTTPQYATNMTFFVTTTAGRGVSDSYQGALFSQQRVKSYADLLAGDRLARAIVDRHGIDLTSAQVQKRISASAVPNTVLLDATVTDPSPHRSQQIATALVAEFESLVRRLETPPDGTGPEIKVEAVAGPLLDPAPVRPRPLLNLGIALLIGLAGGVGAAALREALDTSVKSADALPSLTESPVLGTIPFDSAAKQSPLIVLENAHSQRAEAFRHLRTNLRYLNVDRPVRSLVVTSAVPDEGKSATAANLAIAFASAGQRVLAVEADLRRPRLARYLGVKRSAGLSDVLVGRSTLEHAQQRWGETNLWVLPAGYLPTNPSELLGSQSMAALLDELRRVFDVVIVDTPPLLQFTDAAVAAARVDGALLVVRSGTVTQAQVTGAAATLRSANARVLGTVLNRVKAKSAPGYYAYGYGKRADAAPAPPVPVIAAGSPSV
jgi:capsular exopolysaccharide synthesis family protein